MNRFIFLLLAFLPFIGLGQTGILGGFTTIKGFGVQGVYPGIHLGVEIPRDDETSVFGRIVATLPNRLPDSLVAQAKEVGTYPDAMIAKVDRTMSYINFEGGTRYYFGNGYDYGWSAYGGSLISLSVCPVKFKGTGDFDETKYDFVDADFTRIPTKGSLVTLNFGFNVGVKNHFSFGMLYFDLNLSYALLAIPSNVTAQQLSLYSPLILGANFGFRKDLY